MGNNNSHSIAGGVEPRHVADAVIVHDGDRVNNAETVKSEIVALEDDGDGYYGTMTDYNFENSYDDDDSYSYGGGGGGVRGAGYGYSHGSESGGHLCQLCGKYYRSAGSLKNHRSLYHRSEIGKNRAVVSGGETTNAAAVLGQSLASDDFDLGQIQ